jgi:hypothetical protein
LLTWSMAMPPGVQAFRRSFAGTLQIHPPRVKYHPAAFGEIPLHPPFVEPGVDVSINFASHWGEG